MYLNMLLLLHILIYIYTTMLYSTCIQYWLQYIYTTMLYMYWLPLYYKVGRDDTNWVQGFYPELTGFPEQNIQIFSIKSFLVETKLKSKNIRKFFANPDLSRCL